MNINQVVEDYYMKNVKGKPLTEKTVIDSFIAGINHALEQKYKQALTSKITDGVVTLDSDNYTATIDYHSVKLPKKVFQLAHCLLLNRGKIVKRKDILKTVWGEDVWVEERTIDVHIRKIRQFITTQCIETVKGIGYKWK